MVGIGAVLWFDVSSIGTMFKTATTAMLANLFLSGAMLKGAVIGAAVGMAMPSLRREPALARLPLSTRRETGGRNPVISEPSTRKHDQQAPWRIER